ncbi:MAG: tRNA (adenosine(37)-N6)-threonylcarbamoyltransferase complex ATPase subunit type 1 TsaE [Bacteroidota bacterium]
MELLCQNLNDLPSIARALLSAYPDRRIFAFYGGMGAGKTTFIKILCQELGAVDEASSPTFSIVNQYLTPEGSRLYHFDFYRIKKVEEAYDIGYENYFFSGDYCFIEWPEKITELLPEDSVEVRIEETEPEGLRRFAF